jgi:hypothetical protein
MTLPPALLRTRQPLPPRPEPPATLATPKRALPNPTGHVRLLDLPRILSPPPTDRLNTTPPTPTVPAAPQPRVLTERLHRKPATAFRAALMGRRPQPRRLPPNLLLLFPPIHRVSGFSRR